MRRYGLVVVVVLLVALVVPTRAAEPRPFGVPNNHNKTKKVFAMVRSY